MKAKNFEFLNHHELRHDKCNQNCSMRRDAEWLRATLCILLKKHNRVAGWSV